eukprot:GHVQ01002460.1.p1 GENE.GHVQ01002460.1~~GHVQ01002460.1.p1  ORF type:complete len:802 (+),score=131.37 GHVQ01002460.1:228-2633(+)
MTKTTESPPVLSCMSTTTTTAHPSTCRTARVDLRYQSLPMPLTLNFIDDFKVSTGGGAGNLGTLSIHDLMENSSGEMTDVLLSNYMFDFDWILSECPELVSVKSLTVLHGQTDRESKQEITGALMRLENMSCPKMKITSYTPPLQYAYGTYHSKMIIIRYTNPVKLRVVITTANFIFSDWCKKNQAIWVQDFLPHHVQHRQQVTTTTETTMTTTAAQPTSTSRPSSLAGCTSALDGNDLLYLPLRDYLRVCRVSNSWLETLAEFDFSPSTGALVASVPGYHRDQAKHKWGLGRLKILLAEERVRPARHDAQEESQQSESVSVGDAKRMRRERQGVVCQFSSLGSLQEKWLGSFYNILTVSAQQREGVFNKAGQHVPPHPDKHSSGETSDTQQPLQCVLSESSCSSQNQTKRRRSLSPPAASSSGVDGTTIPTKKPKTTPMSKTLTTPPSPQKMKQGTSDVNRHTTTSSRCPLLPLHLIIPTVENVRTSIEGWVAGGSIPIPLTNLKAFLQPYFCQWNSSVRTPTTSSSKNNSVCTATAHSSTASSAFTSIYSRLRTRAMPHIKTYLRYRTHHVGCGDSSTTATERLCSLDWIYMGSHNLSKAAWGEEQKNSTQTFMRSYEIGVLVSPSTLQGKRPRAMCNPGVTLPVVVSDDAQEISCDERYLAHHHRLPYYPDENVTSLSPAASGREGHGGYVSCLSVYDNHKYDYSWTLACTDKCMVTKSKTAGCSSTTPVDVSIGQSVVSSELRCPPPRIWLLDKLVTRKSLGDHKHLGLRHSCLMVQLDGFRFFLYTSLYHMYMSCV